MFSKIIASVFKAQTSTALQGEVPVISFSNNSLSAQTSACQILHNNLTVRVEDGIYSTEQISKIAKLVKQDSDFVVKSYKMNINGSQINLDKPQDTEMPVFASNYKNETSVVVSRTRALDILTIASSYLDAKNSNSELFIFANTIYAHDTIKAFLCSLDLEEPEVFLNNNNSEATACLEPSHAQIVIDFLSSISDDEITYSCTDTLFKISTEDAVLILAQKSHFNKQLPIALNGLFKNYSQLDTLSFESPFGIKEFTDFLNTLILLDNSEIRLVQYDSKKKQLSCTSETVQRPFNGSDDLPSFKFNTKTLKLALDTFKSPKLHCKKAPKGDYIDSLFIADNQLGSLVLVKGMMSI